jgi:outer membrane lipoprotein-sorting protein
VSAIDTPDQPMKKLAAFLFCLLLLTLPISAQKTGVARKTFARRSPTIAQIIERYLVATGGREKLSKIMSVHAKADFSVEGGTTSTMETFYKSPNKILNIIKVEGSEPSFIGFDGKNVWTANGGGKAKYDSTIDAARFKNITRYRGYLDFEKAFPISQYIGVRKINGANAYLIKLKAAGENTPQTMYFDQKTGLIVRVDSIIPGSYKDKGVIVLYYDDYREVDGIKAPFKFRSIHGSSVTHGTYTLIEFDTDLDDSIFELPREK